VDNSAGQHDIVIVGGSLAGLRAAQNLRRVGHEGRLVIVGAERHLPYDRPPLSKKMLTTDMDPAELALSPPDTYAELDAEMVLGSPATALDLNERLVTVGEDSIPFDDVIIATGAAARNISRADELEGVHTLRTLDDALAIRAELVEGASVVVVGAGFIGSEVAAAASTRGCRTTVVEAAPAPLMRGLGAEMGMACGGLHAIHGVELRLGAGVAALHGSGRVEAVELTDGTRLDADVVVVGIGVTPNTDWLQGSGLTIDNGVVCDATLNAGVQGVWAIGDVVRAPNAWIGPDPVRVEHWTAATEQAMLVAGNVLDPTQAKPYDSVPFVWSDQYDDRIQIAGYPSADDDVQVLVGSIDDRSFVAGYHRDGRLSGVMALNSIKPFVQYRRLLMTHASWGDALEKAAELA
jgi:NADPH-dependent 2,4-dienoyl-CoA reductase/sulfur reductase-like enzyme